MGGRSGKPSSDRCHEVWLTASTNGAVERANRTHTEEFHQWSLSPPTVAALGAELREWERIYNTVRPHQTLGYLTPKEFLDQWNQQHARKEVVSRR